MYRERQRMVSEIEAATAAWSPMNYDSAAKRYRNIGRANRQAWGSRGLVLNGASGTLATTPDAAALGITGDIDIRVQLTLASYLPAALTALAGKYQSGSISWRWRLETNGTMRFVWSENGTDDAYSKLSNAATGITGSTTWWLRVTLDVDNGSSQNVLRFYKSTDGSNWTQIGTDVITANTTSIFSGTSALEIGRNGSSGAEAAGRFHRCQVYNGIGGTLAFDTGDMSLLPTGSAAFTAATGQTVTLAGAAVIADPGGLAEPGGTATPVRVLGQGRRCHYFSGVASNTVTIANPDDPAAKEHTITYIDGTTDTVSPDGATLTFGGTDVKFAGLRVTRIHSTDGKIDLNFASATQTAVPNVGTAGGSAAINRSTSGKKSVQLDGTTPGCWLADGSDDYLECADNDLLDFGADDNFTVMALLRTTGAFSAVTDRIAGKRSGNIRYMLIRTTNTGEYKANISDGTTAKDSPGVTTTINALSDVSLIRSGGNLYAQLGGTRTSATASANLDTRNASALKAFTEGGSTFAAAEGHGLAIHRFALSATRQRILDYQLKKYCFPRAS